MHGVAGCRDYRVRASSTLLAIVNSGPARVISRTWARRGQRAGQNEAAAALQVQHGVEHGGVGEGDVADVEDDAPDRRVGDSACAGLPQRLQGGLVEVSGARDHADAVALIRKYHDICCTDIP